MYIFGNLIELGTVFMVIIGLQLLYTLLFTLQQ